MSENQLGLALPRKRVALASEAPERAGGDFTVDVEAFIGFTSWETQSPPTRTGWYGITDHRTGTVDTRWWFDGQQWRTYVGDPCDHESFSTMYAWRGLRAPHPDGYDGMRSPAQARRRVTLVGSPWSDRALL